MAYGRLEGTPWGEKKSLSGMKFSVRILGIFSQVTVNYEFTCKQNMEMEFVVGKPVLSSQYRDGENGLWRQLAA